MIEIVKPKITDAEGLAQVHVKTWQDTYSGLIDDAYLDSLSIAQKAEKWKKRLLENNSDFIYFIAKENDSIAGFIWGGKNREENSEYDAEVIAYYVLPEYQGKGIGRKLFSSFAKEALKRKMNTMSLWVLYGNNTSKIYEHFGGKYIKSKMEEIPSNSGKKYKEDMYAYADLRKLVE